MSIFLPQEDAQKYKLKPLAPPPQRSAFERPQYGPVEPMGPVAPEPTTGNPEIDRQFARVAANFGDRNISQAGAGESIGNALQAASVPFELLDSPRGALAASLTPDTGMGLTERAGQGFLRPQQYPFRNAAGFNQLPDEDIIGSLSLRDIAGGVGDVFLDPSNYIPAAGKVDDVARAVGRRTSAGARALNAIDDISALRAVDDVADSSTMGILRPAKARPGDEVVTVYRSIPATWSITDPNGRNVVRQIEDSGYDGLGRYWGDEATARHYSTPGSILYEVDFPKAAVKGDDINGSLVPPDVAGRLKRATYITQDRAYANATYDRAKDIDLEIPDGMEVFSSRTNGEVQRARPPQPPSPGAVQRATDVPFRPRIAGGAPFDEDALFAQQAHIERLVGEDKNLSSAIAKIQDNLSIEEQLRARGGIAEQELRAGRRNQLGRVGTAQDEAASGGLTISEAARLASEEAKTGKFRKTFAPGTNLTDDESRAISRLLASSPALKGKQGEYLNYTNALDQFLKGGDIQPEQRKRLSDLIGVNLEGSPRPAVGANGERFAQPSMFPGPVNS